MVIKDGKAGEALLSVPLNPETAANACILLVVDLSSPREILQTLKQSVLFLVRVHNRFIKKKLGGHKCCKITCQAFFRGLVAHWDIN